MGTEPTFSMPQRLGAEALGTMFLLASIVGSGIMGENLAGGNVALAVFAVALSVGCVLVVIIQMFGPISGAHFNPAVTFAFLLQRQISLKDSLLYIPAQIVGAVAGTLLAHAMFDHQLFVLSETARSSSGQWISEGVATFGLLATVLYILKWRPKMVPAGVGLYIASAIWFTGSTAFANPAVTVGRVFTDTLTGIDPDHALAFIIAEFAGAALAVWVFNWMTRPQKSPDNES